MTARPVFQKRPAIARSASRVTKASATARKSPFLADMLSGLSKTPKRTPPKYFYDEKGSELFEQITRLPEYYPTRTEMGILSDNVGDLADFCGPECLLVEPGAGNLTKARLILDRLKSPAAFIPLDVSGAHLRQAATVLRGERPGLNVVPLCADFTTGISLPAIRSRKRVIFFPGSTLGNFEPHEADRLLASFAALAGEGGGIILGVDLRKDASILVPAYDDAQGVTAAFNKNLLVRMRDELGAQVEVDHFAHRAVYNPELGRVEMHLVSLRNQTIRLADKTFQLTEGETIHTENSYKQDIQELAGRCARIGLRVDKVLTDSRAWFAVLCLSVANGG